MKKTFNKEVIANLKQTINLSPDILTENDLAPLPKIVQKYLRYVGVVGKEKIRNMRVKMEKFFTSQTLINDFFNVCSNSDLKNQQYMLLPHS